MPHRRPHRSRTDQTFRSRPVYIRRTGHTVPDLHRGWYNPREQVNSTSLHYKFFLKWRPNILLVESAGRNWTIDLEI